MPHPSRVDSLLHRGVRRLLDRLGNPPMRFVLWDGSGFGANEAEAIGTVRIHDRVALLRLGYDLAFEAGDLYAEGRLSIEGDLIGLIRKLLERPIDTGLVWKLFPKRWILGALRNDLRRARESAHHHYDVGNDFYSLWLDERMVYTCAYFPTPDVTLEEAQLAKLDHVCRKLALRPEERVIEAGCGWGSLALHMARYYGARVRAFNISHEQVAYAREQAEKQDLADRVEFVEDDYRNIRGRCDVFASVGMLEHVGRDHYRDLGSVIARSLEPHGRGLIHSIGRTRAQRLHRWVERRIFPNAYPPTLREMMEIFEPAGLAVLDVENLRRHYALTLRHWTARVERSMRRCIELVGPERARTWHLYLAASAAAFEVGTLELFQVGFSRAGNPRIPWTRAHLYSGAPADFALDQEDVGGAL